MRAMVLVLVAVVTSTVLGPVAPAAAAVTLTVTLTPSAAQVSAGSDITFTVAVTSAAGPVVLGFVTLTRTGADGSVVEVDAQSTDGRGAATFTDAPTVNATYSARAVAEGPPPDYLPDEGTSAPVPVTVSFRVESAASPVAVPPGGQLTLTARSEPAAPGVALVEERAGAGPWRSLGEHPVAADGSLTLPLGRRTQVGTLTYRVTRSGDALRVAGAAETTARVTVTGAGKPGSWRPIGGSKARPAHWGSCRIGWALNPKNMPAYGRADLVESMRRIGQASGLRFRFLGTTSRVPFAGDSRAGVGRITVAWANWRSTKGLLRPGVGGVGGTTRTASGRILTGYLAINTAFSRRAPAGFGEGASHGLVLMHELGHVVGLDHILDRKQIMHPSSAQPAAVWGAGDLSGLARLGKAGGCR